MSNFNRLKFFPIKNIIKSSEIKDILNNLIINSHIYKNYKINDISSFEILRKNSFLFLSKKFFLKKPSVDNLFIVTNKENIYNELDNHNKILVHDIDDTFIKLCNHMFFHEDDKDLEDDSEFINGSFISKNAIIDKSAFIGKNCYIGRGVKIGSNTKIKNNVVIKNSIIGSNVIISDNSTIGSTGFGFSLKNLGAKNIFPHIGIVIVEDNVRIGSNCSIDRGKIDFTLIGRNTMLDNQIHIAHNVIITSNACIAAQSGISGSVTIGKNLIAGGQSGFAGHINIGDNVVVAAKSGVTKNINSKSSVAGYPATDINKWKKNIIKLRKDL